MIKIKGCGAYLPERVLTNEYFEQKLDTTHEWIKTRTGIDERRIAAPGELTSDMGAAAGKLALKDAGLSSSDIDLVIVCTTTPDNSFPATATKVACALGINDSPAFDLQAVCAGFVYGLEVAAAMINSGKYENILLVCAEKMSALVDWNDRSSAILFGDGAGALVLSKDDSNFFDSKIHSDPSQFDILHTSGGIGSDAHLGTIKMQGRSVFRHAVENMTSSLQALLAENNMSASDINFLVPHQANIRILNVVAEKLNLPAEKLFATVHRHANCSAASIPLALNDLKNTGKLKRGDMLGFTAIGGGLVWGSALIKW